MIPATEPMKKTDFSDAQQQLWIRQMPRITTHILRERPTPKSRYVFTRSARLSKKSPEQGPATSANVEPVSPRGGSDASTSKIYVKNVKARYPNGPTWPVQMRADMTAAYLDYDNTKDLCAAIADGHAPPPGALRRRGRTTEVVWFKGILDSFVAGKIVTHAEAS
jgi:hypothetical protein